MAKLQAIEELFIANDLLLEFEIYNDDETEIVDVAGQDLSWMLKRRLKQEDSEAILTKTIGDGITVVGTFDPNPALNYQITKVLISAGDTRGIHPIAINHELKRMDTGFETTYSYGPAKLVKAAHKQ